MFVKWLFVEAVYTNHWLTCHGEDDERRATLDVVKVLEDESSPGVFNAGGLHGHVDTGAPGSIGCCREVVTSANHRLTGHAEGK